MKKYTDKLFCFSPPVMLATLIIEVGLAAYTLWRYRFDRVVQLAVALLVGLAIFQLSEFMVCATSFLDSTTWARIGYIAITLLPPLGMHMAYEIAGAERRRLLPWAYGLAAGFCAFFLLVPTSFGGAACLGNYVLFSLTPAAVWAYIVYYYGLLLAGLYLFIWLARGKASRIQQALYGLLMGYLAFLVPTTTANIVSPETILGIPSIMCGFAVLLAIILVVWVLPRVAKNRRLVP